MAHLLRTLHCSWLVPDKIFNLLTFFLIVGIEKVPYIFFILLLELGEWTEQVAFQLPVSKRVSIAQRSAMQAYFYWHADQSFADYLRKIGLFYIGADSMALK